MIEYIRRKMHWFIYGVVGLFGLSIFIGSASLLFFAPPERPEKEEAKSDAATSQDDATERDEFDVNSKNVAARITLDGTTGVILEGELNQKLKSNDLFRRSGGKIPPQLKGMFLGQFLKNAIDERLIAMKATSMNFDVAADVERSLKTLYQRIGGKEKLKQLNVDEDKFKADVARQVRYQKLIERVVGGRQFSDNVIKSYYEEFQDEFKTEDGVKPFEQVRPEIVRKLRSDISDDDISNYYNEHKERWRKPDKASFRRLMLNGRSPERLAAVNFTQDELGDYYRTHIRDYAGPKQFQLSHIFMDPASDDVRKRITVSDDEVKARYEENKEDYFEEEQYRTAHILFKVKKGEGEDAKGRADAVFAKLRAGEAFEELAKELSEDTLTRSNGGMGTFWSAGMKPEELENQVFEMQVGEIRGPLRTPRGYEVVRLAERTPPSHSSLDKVRAEIFLALQRSKAQELVKQDLTEIRGKINSEELSFDAAAGKYSQAPSAPKGGALPPLSLGQNKGVAEVAEVGEAGFIDYGIQNAIRDMAEGRIKGPIQSSRGFHIVRLNHTIPAKPRPLEECKVEVERDFRKFLADGEVQQLVLDIAAKIRKGELTFASAVEKYSEGADKASGGLWADIILDEGAKPDVAEELLKGTLSNYGLNRHIVQAVRSLEKGQVSGAVPIGDTYNIFSLVKMAQPSYEPLDDEKREQIRFALNPEVPEGEIAKYFDENKESYRKAPSIVIQHVMCHTENKATEVLESARAGQDFDLLVREHTIDHASKKNKGVVSQEFLPKAMKDAIEKVEAGEVVPEVVRSAAGFHVVKLVKRETEKAPRLEDVRGEIREELLKPLLNDLLQQYVKEMRKQAVIETWESPDRPLPITSSASHLSASSPDLTPREGEAGQ